LVPARLDGAHVRGRVRVRAHRRHPAARVHRLSPHPPHRGHRRMSDWVPKLLQVTAALLTAAFAAALATGAQRLHVAIRRRYLALGGAMALSVEPRRAGALARLRSMLIALLALSSARWLPASLLSRIERMLRR